MAEFMKIVIPMAGWILHASAHLEQAQAARQCGKTSLEHLLDMFKTLPDPDNTEYIFILGPYLGEYADPAFHEGTLPEPQGALCCSA